MAQERGVKRSESEERKEPYNILNRSEQHRTTTEWKMVTEKKREEKKHSNAKEPYESAKKKKKVTKDRQLGGTIPQQSPRKKSS